MRAILTFVLLMIGVSATAEIPSAAKEADIVILGEVHDNPAHHVVQARWVQTLQPTALVFEMISAESADWLTAADRADAKRLESALQWEARGWPDFAMYFPIFDAAPAARVFGANVPSENLMALRDTPLAEKAGALAEVFALNEDLPPDEWEKRLDLQHMAHCEAMPRTLLPMMVNAQRLRDATLADAALRALAETGGPVAVITGNGHARKDWGVPHLIEYASDASVYALGQSEGGKALDGGFDMILDAPAIKRPDPCAAFR